MEDKKFIEISWKGPYTIEQLDQLDQLGSDGGLYIMTGKKYYERVSDIQYIGITERPYKQRFKEHHKIDQITRELKIWVGDITYPTVRVRADLELAEKMFVYYWQSSLNERLKTFHPKPTVVISRFHKVNGDERVRRVAELAELPDVISWDGEYWRQGNLKTFEDA